MNLPLPKRHSQEEADAFGAWLKERRLAKGLTQRQLGLRLHPLLGEETGQKYVSRMERGQKYPNEASESGREIIAKLEEIFG